MPVEDRICCIGVGSYKGTVKISVRKFRAKRTITLTIRFGYTLNNHRIVPRPWWAILDESVFEWVVCRGGEKVSTGGKHPGLEYEPKHAISRECQPSWAFYLPSPQIDAIDFTREASVHAKIKRKAKWKDGWMIGRSRAFWEFVRRSGHRKRKLRIPLPREPARHLRWFTTNL
jgi:hypothetical protein